MLSHWNHHLLFFLTCGYESCKKWFEPICHANKEDKDGDECNRFLEIPLNVDNNIPHDEHTCDQQQCVPDLGNDCNGDLDRVTIYHSFLYLHLITIFLNLVIGQGRCSLLWDIAPFVGRIILSHISSSGVLCLEYYFTNYVTDLFTE